MSNIERIHQGKTPKRTHFIREWAEKRQMSQAELSRQTGADKSLVSRWFNKGMIPSEKNLETIAAAFHIEVASLFRDPSDDWLSRFFAQRSQEDRDRARQILEAAFPSDQLTGT